MVRPSLNTGRFTDNRRIIMHQRIKLLVFFVIGCVTFFASAASWATPITVDNIFNFLDSRSANSAGWTAGERITFGANDVTPNGADGTTGTATQTATSITKQLPWRPFTIFPNQFSNSVYYAADRESSWDLTFSNGDDETQVSTLDLAGVTPIPFVRNMSLTNASGNALTPTFNWTLPTDTSSFDHTQIRIYDLDNRLPVSNQADQIFQEFLSKDQTEFTLPDGYLSDEGNYSVSIQLEKLREEGIPQEQNRLLSRSRAFFDFTTIAGDVTNPVFLPTVDTGTEDNPVYNFDIDVVDGETIFIDPLIAIGYEYAVGLGDPNFASVLLPSIGDNEFILELFDSALNEWIDTANLTAGDEYFFESSGVDRFRILGIETSAMLDPNNATAFITGLTFNGGGQFTGTMTPITIYVPEPATIILLGLGLAGITYRRKKTG